MRLNSPRWWWQRNRYRLLHSLTMPFRAVSSAFRWLGHMMRSWWAHRRFQYFLRGIPTLLVITICGYLAMVTALRPPAALAEKYTQAAQTAMGRSNYPAAKIFYRRVIELDAADNRAMFNLAKAAGETEDYAQVAVLMERLAPIDRPVFVDAHILQATQHLAQSGSSPEHLRSAEAQLRNALLLSPEDDNIHSMLGEIYFREGLWGNAARHLSRVALKSPLARLLLAKTYAMQGDLVKAKRYGTDDQGHYARLLLKLHFRRSGCEGDELVEECLYFLPVGLAEQSGQKMVLQHFPGD